MLVNGKQSTTISIEDRGLLYGDGIFETILCEQGKPILFEQHMQRFMHGCEQLDLIAPDQQDILNEVMIAADNSDCVIKLLLTRGVRGRGYYYAKVDAATTRIVYRSQLPAFPLENYRQGIRLYLCEHKLAQNEKLAGIKHLNRLDQVVGRAEWDTQYQEGVMLNHLDEVIEGTMSNIFMQKKDTWITPIINQSGVRGVLRDYIIQHANDFSVKIKEDVFHLDDLLQADAIFVCNSVIGIWPVNEFQGKQYSIHSETIAAMQYLNTNVSSLYSV